MEDSTYKKRCSSSETRTKILNTADRLFYERGIKSVGIDTIIAESNVAKMSLYKHFSSKEALVIEYLNKREKEFFDDFCFYLNNEESKNPILDYFEFIKPLVIKNDVSHCPFLNAIIEFPDPQNSVHIFIVEHKKKIRTLLIETIKRMKIKDPEEFADKITLLWHGAIMNRQIFGKDYSLDPFINTLKDLFKKVL